MKRRINFCAIKYPEIDDDARSVHIFNYELIFQLDALKKQIADFAATQKVGAEFPTQKEQDLQNALVNARILWPLVKDDILPLHILTKDQIDLFNSQVEFLPYKSFQAVTHQLQKQLKQTEDFILSYKGSDARFRDMRENLLARNTEEPGL